MNMACRYFLGLLFLPVIVSGSKVFAESCEDALTQQMGATPFNLSSEFSSSPGLIEAQSVYTRLLPQNEAPTNQLLKPGRGVQVSDWLEAGRLQIFFDRIDRASSPELLLNLIKLREIDAHLYAVIKRFFLNYVEKHMRVRSVWLSDSFQVDDLGFFELQNLISEYARKLEKTLNHLSIELRDDDYLPQNIRLWPWPSDRSLNVAPKASAE